MAAPITVISIGPMDTSPMSLPAADLLVTSTIGVVDWQPAPNIGGIPQMSKSRAARRLLLSTSATAWPALPLTWQPLARSIPSPSTSPSRRGHASSPPSVTEVWALSRRRRCPAYTSTSAGSYYLHTTYILPAVYQPGRPDPFHGRDDRCPARAHEP